MCRTNSLAQVPLNDLPVLTAAEIEEQVAAIYGLLENCSLPQGQLEQLTEKLAEFQSQWQVVFTKFGQNYRGELAYRDLIGEFSRKIAPLLQKWLSSSVAIQEIINPITSMLSTLSPSPPLRGKDGEMLSLHQRKRLLIAKKKHQSQLEVEDKNLSIPEFEKPVFIVSAPRAGSSLLFETLAKFPDLWTIGDESHEIIEGIPALHPAARNFSSNRLDEGDATPEISATLRKGFTQQLQNREGVKYLNIAENESPNKIRFLEKTPKNALRVPFLKAVFPDALFIYLYRDARENISSLLEGWRSHRFIAYQPLPGWEHSQWSFLLVPGWSSLQESALVEIAAYQWKMANSYLIEDLQSLNPSCWCPVNYRDLIEHPGQTINHIAQFAQLDQDQQIEQILSQPLPIAQRTLSAPRQEKWRKHERELATVLPDLENIIDFLQYLK